ncbi:MAG: histidine ammonia-lyase [candidate division WOR-3 bacterium]
MTIFIPQKQLTTEVVGKVAHGLEIVLLDKNSYPAINRAHQLIKNLANAGKPIYGVNTGFGALANILINQNKLGKLQKNLILSHAVGSGAIFDKEIVRAAMFLRANMLAKGYSGVSRQLISTILQMLNKDIVPVVLETGSVGASGDLSPLAFIAQTLLGIGKVYYQNQIISARAALKKAKIKPISLQPKEGLSLINGTEFMSAIGVLVINKSLYLVKLAEIASAMSIVALQAKMSPYDFELMKLKPHAGQLLTTRNLQKLLKGYQPNNKNVQDAYSLRCIPQVIGAVRQGINFAKEIIETEINAITDNPVVLKKKNQSYQIISGGNFHGQAISLAFDNLAISLTTIGLIAERRIYRLLDDKLSNLPAFLVKNPGINSGLMMLQVLASALCAENKVLANPASIHSLPTSAGQEDFVSMGMTAANKVRRILANTLTILALEFICARQAIALAKYPLPANLNQFYSIIAHEIPFITDDRAFQNDIDRITKLINEQRFQRLVHNEIL